MSNPNKIRIPIKLKTLEQKPYVTIRLKHMN